MLLRKGHLRMNWDWATSLDHIWRSPTFPMWLTLAAAGFFGIIVLITLLRAEKSVANGALTVITLLAIGVAGAVTSAASAGQTWFSRARRAPVQTATRAVGAAFLHRRTGRRCRARRVREDAVRFGRSRSAAAVAYAASQITLLTALGDVATAEQERRAPTCWRCAAPSSATVTG